MILTMNYPETDLLPNRYKNNIYELYPSKTHKGNGFRLEVLKNE